MPASRRSVPGFERSSAAGEGLGEGAMDSGKWHVQLRSQVSWIEICADLTSPKLFPIANFHSASCPHHPIVKVPP